MKGVSLAMRVLLVDDHPLFREAVKGVIESYFSLSVVQEASTGEETIRLLTADPVELIILDINLPDHSGVVVLRRIKQSWPSVKCLMLTMHEEPRYVRLAMSCGASGYLTKMTDSAQLRDAIHRILSGHQVVMEPFQRMIDQPSKEGEMRWPHERLSVRELEVLSLLAHGRTPSQAAKRLRLSVKTVSTYRTRLLEKLSLETTADLIRYAVDHRLA